MRTGRPRWVISLVLFLIVFMPVLTMAIWTYARAYRELTAHTLERRQAIAYLVATSIRHKLDHLVELGTSLATRVRFRALVAQGQWEEAIEILREVPRDFPGIGRVFLADRQGTLRADTPALAGVRGQSFAFRDWYRGVSQDWRPYVSEVYRRSAHPREKVVAVAVPIHDQAGEATGILVLQIEVRALVEWMRGIELGSAGTLFIVDRHGRLMAHPRFPPEGDIIDFSSVPSVQKVLRGQRGVEVLFNPIEKVERLTAYEPVVGHGWGVVVAQPTRLAFALRDRSLRMILVAYGLICLFSAALAWLVVRAMAERRRREEEVRRLNQALARRAADLEAVNKELDAFSYSVSHDMRTPLRHLSGFAALLKEHADSRLDDKGRRYLDTISSSARRMEALVDDLLAFSRMGRAELRHVRVQLGELVTAVLKELETDTNGRAIDWRIQPLPEVDGDPEMLRLALENLLSNAVKYTAPREEARIEIGAMDGPRGDTVVFVRDNGVGFDMQYAHKLFGVFQRLHRSEEFKGTGIGLANVRRIIQRHGGETWAEGQVGSGATFYFSLPKRQEDRSWAN